MEWNYFCVLLSVFRLWFWTSYRMRRCSFWGKIFVFECICSRKIRFVMHPWTVHFIIRTIKFDEFFFCSLQIFCRRDDGLFVMRLQIASEFYSIGSALKMPTIRRIDRVELLFTVNIISSSRFVPYHFQVKWKKKNSIQSRFHEIEEEKRKKIYQN